MPVIRREYLGFDVASSRQRPEADCRILADRRSDLAVVEVQGALYFAAVEALIRRLHDRSDGAELLLLDFRRAQVVDPGALDLLRDSIRREVHNGRRVLLSHADAALRERLSAAVPGREGVPLLGPLAFDTTDIALEWCEDQVLGAAAPTYHEARWSLAALDLFDGFSKAEIAALEGHVQAFVFEPGEIVLKEGDPARMFFIIASGVISVVMPSPSGELLKIATLGPGVTFGEMALLDDAPRSATVIAETRLVAYGLPASLFKNDDPDFIAQRQKLIGNFARQLSGRLRRANQAVQTLI